MIVQAVVDQSWSLASSPPSHGGIWIIPIFLMIVLVVAIAVQRKPWLLIGLGLGLLIGVPLFSALLLH